MAIHTKTYDIQQKKVNNDKKIRTFVDNKPGSFKDAFTLDSLY